MKISTKLILLSSVFAVLLAATGLLTVGTSRQISKALSAAHAADMMIRGVFELNIITYQYIMHHEKRMEQQWQLKYDSFGKLLDRTQGKNSHPERQTTLAIIAADYKALGNLFSQLQSNFSRRKSLIGKNGPETEINMTYALEERLMTQTLMRAQKIVSGAFEFSGTIQKGITKHRQRTNLIVLLSIVGFAVLSLFTSFFTVKSITVPIRMLAQGVEIVGNGNLEHKLGTETKDELGQFSRAFDRMIEKLKQITASRDELEQEINERKLAEASLLKLQKELEQRVKERTKALETANEELSQYAHVVSHDLKAPLRAIHNYADFLREDLEGALDEEQKGYLDGLNLAASQGAQLVNDLLTLSRIGSTGAAHEAIDMDVFVHELESALKLPDSVELSLTDDLPAVKADKTLLSQIFQNLIENAVKFNDSPVKRIRIGRGDTGGAGVEFFVQDNGIGIESRFFDKVFQIFQRLHTRQEYGGTGVGLAIVKKAADKLGGSVRVESEPGRGSTFFVSIPEK